MKMFLVVCAECFYYEFKKRPWYAWHREEYWCLHPNAIVLDIIDGTKSKRTCIANRWDSALCGPSGKWFKEKEDN